MLMQPARVEVSHFFVYASIEGFEWFSHSNTIVCPPVRGENHQLQRVNYLAYRWTTKI